MTGHRAGIDYHRRLLADDVRTEAFRKAIEATVGPDDVVVDIGAGTGILSLFAARAGARKVYAVESTAIAHLAQRIVRDNGFTSKIEVIRADARDVELPELATVLVSECLGNFLMSDGMISALASCRRLLAPGHVLITGPGVTTHWGQTLFPIPATDVEPGDKMTFELRVELDSDDLAAYHWSGSFASSGQPPCVFFDRGQDLRFTPWLAEDRSD